MGEQALARRLHTAIAQRSARERRESVARKQQDQKQQQAEHGSRKGQPEAARDGFADQLTEQDEAETRKHNRRIKGCAGKLVNRRAMRGTRALRAGQQPEAASPSACRTWWRSASSGRRTRQRPWPRRTSACGR